MDNNIKILGETWLSIVVMPPVRCGINPPPNSIGKIASYAILKREYDFIMEYLKYSPTYSSHVNKESIILCKLNKEDLMEQITSIIDNPDYQLIMPYLGKTFDTFLTKYKNNCENYNSKTAAGLEIISANVFIKYMNALKQLFNEILTLNTNRVYHGDIKTDNLIYNEETNSLFLIDFNTSIINNIPEYYVHDIKYYQDFKDILLFIERVLFEFLLIGLSNKYIYYQLKDIYVDIKKYISLVVTPILGLRVDIMNKDFIDVKNKLIEYVNSVMSIVESMDPNATTVENTNTDYCKLKFKIPASQQNEYASKYMKNIDNMKKEVTSMGMEDKRGGLKKKKTKFSKKNKKTIRNKKTMKKKHLKRSLHKF